MAMPTWDGFMAPVLRQLLPGTVIKRRDLEELVIAAEHLSDEERTETLSSGQLKYRNRIGWATSYLSRVGAIARPSRGEYMITDVGRQLLANHPAGITEKDLRVLAGDSTAPHTWKALRAREGKAGTVEADPTPVSDLDPEEQISDGIGRINATVADDLRTRLHDNTPSFFEDTVVALLVAMGYGGAGGKATVTQASNDGGIDGIIDQDALGLSRVYVQAKRYAPDNSVGRPELQAFVGALSGKADSGVFITTGRFSKGAVEYAEIVPTRIILIDGVRLAELMIRYGVGVQVKQTLQIVEVDEDFFE
ncbi:restriction endonuclease [Tsukamurella spumae]|uniref:Restriction endonuclease n=1 Tax=Tsukamurella spumae TaxID=44753 RepID=A0A846X5Q0_9ACTN|nr:restriction endonuclease [Tsukamurella spumae]NKY21017.1 restriction endonuclease [Tsukamurella spumae]